MSLSHCLRSGRRRLAVEPLGSRFPLGPASGQAKVLTSLWPLSLGLAGFSNSSRPWPPTPTTIKTHASLLPLPSQAISNLPQRTALLFPETSITEVSNLLHAVGVYRASSISTLKPNFE